MGPGKFLLRKTGRYAEGRISSCEGKPGGRPKAEFLGALARRTAGATLVPLRAHSWFASQRTRRKSKRTVLRLSVNAYVAASDSWPLNGVCAFDGSRLGPLSDPLGAYRRMHERFSLGRSVARTVGLRTARHRGRVTQVL